MKLLVEALVLIGLPVVMALLCKGMSLPRFVMLLTLMTVFGLGSRYIGTLDVLEKLENPIEHVDQPLTEV
jgi:hypothetical protein